jgi:NAD(P)H dehydrogenase (quinone)
MSKSILIVVANPKKESLSFSIAKKYLQSARKQGCFVEILDLYRDENQQPFFSYDNDPYEREATKEMLYYQDKILKADEIVFVFPYWWGSMPAILKNFFDWNFSMGFAATFENGRPKGLLKNKSVKVFTTTGTPSFLYAITGANRRLKNMFKEQIFDFCAMKLEGFHIFGGVDSDTKNIENILNKVEA